MSEKVKTVDFFQKLLQPVRDLKVGIVSEYWQSMTFLDLCPRSFTYEISNLLFSETQPNFVCKL